MKLAEILESKTEIDPISFLVRVELHGEGNYPYKELHENMSAEGFSTEVDVRMRKGDEYIFIKSKLPTAEYFFETSDMSVNVSTVSEKAMSACKMLDFDFSLLVVKIEGDGIAYNLSKC